jgi:two-component system LytT family response regulator
MIVEDNLLEKDMLESLLQEIDTIKVVAVCSNGVQAAQELQKTKVDIVFSDIDMPKLSGIELLKSLQNPPVFIFTSAHRQYAADSYDLDVADFIVKPVVLSRLLRAIDKAINLVEKNKRSLEPVESSKEIVSDFFVNTLQGLVKVLVGDVAYIESEANYSNIQTVNGNKHLVLANLKNLEAQLPSDCFIRVHRQFIVNKNNITIINQASVVLKGEYEVPLSNTHKRTLLDAVAVLERLAKK